VEGRRVSKSSKSSSSSTTQQYDERVGASDSAIAVGGRANVNVEITSPEEVGQLLAGASAVVEQSFDLAREAQAVQTRTLGDALSFIGDNNRSEESDLARKAILIGGAVLIVTSIFGGKGK